MKIAHLTTVDMSLRYLLLPQLEAARELGESIGISAAGAFVPELESRSIRHIALASSTRGMNLLADLRAIGQLWRVLRHERPDILHTHNPKPGVYGRIVGRLAGVPIVVNTVHGLYATPDSSLPKRMVVYTLEWIASRFSDAELIQSPEDFELLWERGIMPRSKLRLLGNGVDLERFRPDPGLSEPVRQELGLTDGQIAVGLVARLVEEKGVPELIEAAERLDDRYVVVIVGPRDHEKADAVSEELLARAEANGVRFLGMRQDVERIYQGLDIFVLPSHREGFPRAAMEAAASGLPVIATDIRGCRQVVDDGVNGILFPVRDVGALAAAIMRVGADAGMRSMMSQASTDRAHLLFDEREIVNRVMGTYAEVAKRKGLFPALVERWGGD
ncbi:MAG TPA: glycosyltransferase family 4 protein [Acidimicrobiia bacterium]|nr:glycosyltransferase family 4 protein [Acidimicrobiia bacterium]